MGHMIEASTMGFMNASSYDAYRPSYPADAVALLLQHLQISGLLGARIIDLGAGTGKFTEHIAAREESFQIVAVEPNDGMRAELEKKGLNNVQVVKGEAQSLPVETRKYDAVIAAQAFHWFANMDTLNEIYRVLAPGGSLGMIWNIEDYNAPASFEPSTQWETKLKNITWLSGNDASRFRHEQWRKVFDDQIESNPFAIQSANPLFSLPIGQGSTKFTHWLKPDDVWNRYRTLSQFAAMDEKQLEGLKIKVYAAMTSSDVEKNDIGEIALHGRTLFAWTIAIPGIPLTSGG